MTLCPNCGQDVASDSDRFCPHCGYALPVSDPAATAQPAYQTSAQPARPPTYTTTAPGGYSAPTYTAGSGGSNLPLPSMKGASRSSRTTGMLRSLLTQDTRMLLALAAVVVVAIVAIVLIFKIVSWFLGLWWLWLILLVALGYSQRRRRRGGRLP